MEEDTFPEEGAVEEASSSFQEEEVEESCLTSFPVVEMYIDADADADSCHPGRNGGRGMHHHPRRTEEAAAAAASVAGPAAVARRRVSPFLVEAADPFPAVAPFREEDYYSGWT